MDTFEDFIKILGEVQLYFKNSHPVHPNNITLVLCWSIIVEGKKKKKRGNSSFSPYFTPKFLFWYSKPLSRFLYGCFLPLLLFHDVELGQHYWIKTALTKTRSDVWRALKNHNINLYTQQMQFDYDKIPTQCCEFCVFSTNR